MSEISRELQEHGRMNEAMRKLFPTAPRLGEKEAEQIQEEERKAAQARAEVILAHIRELGNDY